jgi:hypothetical protein
VVRRVNENVLDRSKLFGLPKILDNVDTLIVEGPKFGF